MPRFTVDLDKDGNLRLTANDKGEDIRAVMDGYPFYGKIPPSAYDGKMAVMKLNTKEDFELFKAFVVEHHDMHLTIGGNNFTPGDKLETSGRADALGSIDRMVQNIKSTSAPSTFQAPTAATQVTASFSGGLFTVTMKDAFKALQGWFPTHTVKQSADGKSASVQCKTEADGEKAKTFVSEMRVSNASRIVDDIGTWMNGLKSGLLQKASAFFSPSKK